MEPDPRRPARTGGSNSTVLSLPAEIRYEKQGRTVIITLDRTDRHNALSLAMMKGIADAFAAFQADDELWVAVLTGAGDRAFCAGGDLDETIGLLTEGGRRELVPDDTKRFFSDVFKPIVCAVNGYCIAGGMEMLLGTDIRIAAPHATFGLGEVRWGLIPAGGSHTRLVRQIPWAVAMEILLMGRTITAERAREVGLVNEIVPADRLLDRALEVAETLCSNGPLAVRAAKQIAVRSMQLEASFVLESLFADQVFASSDAKEGPKAFLEKRTPRFDGR